jgi:3-isopropylmalate/(R)-2-methylmalate dehydratase small subunit
MEKFQRLISRAAPMPAADIDTDIIFPARFLLITEKTGLGRYAFYDWRHGPGGGAAAEFVLNQPAYSGAKILICGDNFGCGSSREQAPWALRDLGVTCLISTSFGEIFRANCFKNAMLPIVLPPEPCGELMRVATVGGELEVDLTTCTISGADIAPMPFEVDPSRREALLEGWDEIAIALRKDADAIAAFEQRQRAAQPWLYERD